MRGVARCVVGMAAGVFFALPAAAEDSKACANVSNEEESIAACSRLIDRGKNSRASLAVIYSNRGAAYLNLGDYDAALRDLNESLHLNAQGPLALYNRGAVYYFRGAYDDAIRDLTRSLNLEPSSAKAYLYRGRAHHDSGRYGEAVKDYTESVRLDPSNADAYEFRGRAFAVLDDYNSALADLDKAVAMGQSGAALWNSRADILVKLGRATDALDAADKALAIDPEYAIAMTTRGEALEKLGRRDEAVSMFNRAVVLQADIQEAKDGLARLGVDAAAEAGNTQPESSEQSRAPPSPPPVDTQIAPLSREAALADQTANRASLASLQGAYNVVGMSLMLGLSTLDAERNVVLSPFSIGVAMAMTEHGASGETQAEMQSVLRLKGTRREIATTNSLAINLVRSERPSGPPLPSWAREIDTPLARGPGVELKIANALAPGPRVKLATDYVADLLVNFGAEALQGATLQSINDWVKDKTEGRVPAIVDALDPNFAAVLLNAVSLTARWEEPFNPTDTLEQEFTTAQGQKKQVPMMQRVGNFVVADGNGVRAIALPYADPAVEMIVMLPDDVDALSPRRVVQTFSGPISAAWGGLAQTGPKRVRLLLPRFKCEFKADLSEAFKSMGIVRAFSSAKAEFGNMVGPSGGPLFIDKVLHRAMIEVGELGTEAAAATAVVMAPGAGATDRAEQPLDFVVERPFVFVIGDKRSGATLFAGIVADPTAK